jgi:hypothetical protein
MTSCQGQVFVETNFLGEMRHPMVTAWRSLSQIPRGRDPSRLGRGMDASSPTSRQIASIGPAGHLADEGFEHRPLLVCQIRGNCILLADAVHHPFMRWLLVPGADRRGCVALATTAAGAVGQPDQPGEPAERGERHAGGGLRRIMRPRLDQRRQQQEEAHDP